MKVFISGIGPGHADLITLRAYNAAKESDLIIVPRSRKNQAGIAENVMSELFADKDFRPVFFPMINNIQERSKIIFSQIERINFQDRQKIFFPVIGDSMLYSTGAYFLDAIKLLVQDLQVNFIPGISAHSIASALAGRFLALDEQIFTVIPGTARPDKIKSALESCQACAIYKPSALHEIKSLVEAQKWNIIRVDFASIPEREKIYTGLKALDEINYMSIILLYRGN